MNTETPASHDGAPFGLGSTDQFGACSEARHPWESEMLAMLSDRFGTTTGDLAQRHSKLMRYGHNQHQRSAAALAMLRTLEAEGKVRKMDDQKPIAWMLVAPNLYSPTLASSVHKS